MVRYLAEFSGETLSERAYVKLLLKAVNSGELTANEIASLNGGIEGASLGETSHRVPTSFVTNGRELCASLVLSAVRGLRALSLPVA